LLSRYSDWLRAGRSEDRILVGARVFTHIQTGHRAHPASYTMGTGSFPGVKRPGRAADHPPLLVPSSRKSSAIPLPPPQRAFWSVRITITFILWVRARYTATHVGTCTLHSYTCRYVHVTQLHMSVRAHYTATHVFKVKVKQSHYRP
jgi:hypothetical protein